MVYGLIYYLDIYFFPNFSLIFMQDSGIKTAYLSPCRIEWHLPVFDKLL